MDGLDFSKPDKALESCYDTWAFAEICSILNKTAEANAYKQKALSYKDYWNKDFKDLTKRDVDQMQARGLYQGTIWQYRWFVPFDVAGLIELTDGETNFIDQLKTFFSKDLYNHANEPDIRHRRCLTLPAPIPCPNIGCTP
ncbi:glycoside hydrolase domain-containing protein [Niabella hibiscisoli]|uniref:glycoside hydrolase domain-containing protein n=1 Tax=Niabella hibiscisoli TaxID=1825928 RepID=UPI00374CA5F6